MMIGQISHNDIFVGRAQNRKQPEWQLVARNSGLTFPVKPASRVSQSEPDKPATTIWRRILGAVILLGGALLALYFFLWFLTTFAMGMSDLGSIQSLFQLPM